MVTTRTTAYASLLPESSIAMKKCRSPTAAARRATPENPGD